MLAPIALVCKQPWRGLPCSLFWASGQTPRRRYPKVYPLGQAHSGSQHSGETPELCPQNADQESERPKGLASRRAPRGGTQQEGGDFFTRLTPQNKVDTLLVILLK